MGTQSRGCESKTNISSPNDLQMKNNTKFSKFAGSDNSHHCNMKLEREDSEPQRGKDNFTLDGKEYSFNEIHIPEDEELDNEKGTLEYILYSLLEKAVDGMEWKCSGSMAHS
jgi:hypothetical protein